MSHDLRFALLGFPEGLANQDKTVAAYDRNAIRQTLYNGLVVFK